jgi:hypothetical protein
MGGEGCLLTKGHRATAVPALAIKVIEHFARSRSKIASTTFCDLLLGSDNTDAQHAMSTFSDEESRIVRKADREHAPKTTNGSRVSSRAVGGSERVRV